MQSRWFCLLLVVLCFGISPAMAAQGKSCEWEKPGHDPYMGDIPSAVDHYTDIPAATRNRLKDRMRRLAYDDMATIRSDRIEGHQFYEPAIRDMHFGEGRTCKEVTRRTWPAGHAERGLVYCEDGFCVLVPFVCRNVSRIWQRPVPTAPPAAAAGAPDMPAAGAVPGPAVMQQLPPPPPAGPLDETLPGSAMVLSPLLLPPLRPIFPSRIDFPDEPAIAFYPPSGIPPPLLPSLIPPTPPPPLAPPVNLPEGPRVPPVTPLTPLTPLTPDIPPPPPSIPVSPIPEPGTGLMLGAGLLLLLGFRARAARRARG